MPRASTNGAGGGMAVAERRAAGSAILVVDPAAASVTLRGNDLTVTKKELNLLLALCEGPSTVHTKESLLAAVWGPRHEGGSRTLDSHACRLRRTLCAQGDEFVVNVWGVGYRLVNSGGEALVRVVGVGIEDPHGLALDVLRRLRDLRTDVHQLASLLDESREYSGVEAITTYGAANSLGDVLERLTAVKDRVV